MGGTLSSDSRIEGKVAEQGGRWPVRAAARILMVVLTVMVALVAPSMGPGARAESQHEALSSCCSRSPIRFVQPSGMAIDAHGTLYVADAATGRVAELAANGRLLRQWRSPQLRVPLGIAVDRQGDVYVAEQDTSVITKFSPDGQVLKQWGRPGLDLVTFAFPHAVTVDSVGNLYVSDWGHNRIVKIDSRGRPVTQWAMAGPDPGAFWRPLGIAVNAEDHVYVVDEGGYRVQEFSSSGQLLAARYTRSLPWIAISPESLQISASYGYRAGVAVDATGDTYVTNWSDSSIRKLPPTGKPLPRWAGIRTGQVDKPSGIAVGPNGIVYVADWSTGHLFKITSRIQQFVPWRTVKR